MLDAGFLMAEDSDRRVSLAIGGIALIEGPAPNYSQLKSTLAERIRSIPRCTHVLRTQPFDVGAPKWVNDPGFDLTRHVRRVALPQPGDDSELFRVVADVLERRLDRDRPLWECWVIEGLKGDQWAILVKIHHCMADGISASRVLTRLRVLRSGTAWRWEWGLAGLLAPAGGANASPSTSSHSRVRIRDAEMPSAMQ